ncbi:hypothetical protein PR202_gb08164 [Eleusine coracana subsp. coracana]|uniref:Appr-1-p processing enzyme family protein n=1 Tax=Eleusine coracana subsp. coracana TaxID=191504 RepID=A0AAV5ED76_ELECO|nr:hypothetical protein PR202_gb08164 [Eleusine coracana subsp. coracana]
MQPRSPASASAAAAAMAPGVGGIEPAVTLDQVPRWSDPDQRLFPAADETSPEGGSEPPPYLSFSDPLTGEEGAAAAGGCASRFPVDQEINSRIYLWRGHPWNLEVDAVVNSTNESLDEAHSSPGLHAAAGSGFAEECATLGGCRTGMAKMTNAYDLPARQVVHVIHTVGPKYAVKYHTAAENALSHCYRSCLELLIENGLERLLPLYFPRDKQEEEIAVSKLPADVGDENGETVIDERKIRIRPLPAGVVERAVMDLPLSDSGSSLKRSSFKLDSYLDPSFMSLIKDPDLRRKEQWEKSSQAQKGFNYARLLGYGDLGCPSLSAVEEYSLHSRYLAKANSLNLSEIAEMKIIYRGGVDSEGRPVMVVVGAHFLLRCLDLERFVLHVVKEFEPLIQKPYSIVYFHSAASLQPQPDLGFMKRLQQILGRKHQRNLHAIYVLHPTLGLRTAILAMQMFVDGEVWKKVVYVDRLVQLFKYVPREQLTIPDFVFQYDLEVNGGRGLIVDPRTKHIYQRASSG